MMAARPPSCAASLTPSVRTLNTPYCSLQSSADKAYESALAASMATTKAATKKAEAATAELEKLQSKYNKSVQEGTEQEEIIVMLQQQIQKGKKYKQV